MKEDFTAEEQAALDDMQSDTGEDIAETEQETTTAEPETGGEQADTSESAEGEPEFKSQRDKQKPPEGYVPHGAFHQEREERKRLAAELEELKQWRQQQEKPAEQPPEYADPLTDPDGFRKWAEWNQSQTQEQVAAQQRAQQEAQQRQRLQAQIQRDEAAFTAQKPDYNDAINHMKEQRIAQLRNAGMGDQEISQRLNQDVQGIIQASQAMGMTAPELAYLRAQQLGYAPKGKAPEQSQEAQRMEAQSKAQANTQSLGHGGGAPQQGGLTASQLAEMSDEEIAKLSDEDFRKVMGG